MAFKTLVFLVIFKLSSAMPDPSVNVNVKVNVEDKNGSNGCTTTSDCVLGFKTYKDGAITEDECMQLQCLKGKWKYLGVVSHGCGECQVWGDPHFITFENHTVHNSTYDFQVEGTYVITQQGYENNAMFGVNATFVPCGDGDATCINSTTYYEPGLAIILSLPGPEDDCHSDNQKHCIIQAWVNEIGESFTDDVHSFDATVGPVLIFKHNHIMTNDLNCLNVVGSKGLGISLCVHTSNYAFLYVWPRASLKGQLYGLCGAYTGKEVEGYTKRGGSVTADINSFAESWVSVGKKTIVARGIIPDKCKDPTALAKFTATCGLQNSDICLPPKGPTWQCPIKTAACIYDLCRVPNHDSYAEGYATHGAVDTQVKSRNFCLIGCGNNSG